MTIHEIDIDNCTFLSSSDKEEEQEIYSATRAAFAHFNKYTPPTQHNNIRIVYTATIDGTSYTFTSEVYTTEESNLRIWIVFKYLVLQYDPSNPNHYQFISNPNR